MVPTTVDDLLLELDRERRDLARSERAWIEGRVTDETAWMLALRIRRQRVRELEAQVALRSEAA